MKKKFILMIGPKINMKGGISSVCSTLINSNIVNYINLKYISSYVDGSALMKFNAFFFGFIRALIVLIKDNIDIVHIHTASRASFRRKACFYFLAKIRRKKVIIHVHGAEFMLYYSNASNIEKRIIRHVLNCADKVIALSKTWKEQLQEISPRAQIEIVYNPVNIYLFDYSNNRKQEKFVNILFMGRLGKRKGVYDLIEIIPDIVKRYENVRFLICGDGEVEKVRSIIRKNGLEKFVEVPGWVSGEEKLEYYKKSSIYILPSYNEGLPISVLEAMSSSLPIVSTEVGGIPEAIEDGSNGYLIQPGDNKAFKKAIMELINSKELRQKFGENSLKRAKEKFDITVFINKLISIYNQL